MSKETNETITKKDLARKLAAEVDGLTLTAASDIIGKVTDYMRDGLKAGKSVALKGIGTLCPITRGERKAHDMRAGIEVIVPPQKTVKFKVSRTLKDILNGRKEESK